MAASTAQEPYAALMAKLFSIGGITDAFAKDENDNPWLVLDQPPDGDENWPKCIVRSVFKSGDPRVDAEHFLRPNDLLQIDIFATMPGDVSTLQELVDQLNIVWTTAERTTTSWKIHECRRVSAWRRIEYTQRVQVADGLHIVQFTSDWSFRFGRRQNVA